MGIVQDLRLLFAPLRLFSWLHVGSAFSGWLRAAPTVCSIPLFRLSSFLLLNERVGDLFAAVDGRDDDEEGATSDNEAELAVPYVAFIVCIAISL